jgi:hypothetical protein
VNATWGGPGHGHDYSILTTLPVKVAGTVVSWTDHRECKCGHKVPAAIQTDVPAVPDSSLHRLHSGMRQAEAEPEAELTTYKILDELSGRGIRWLTLRQRGKTELARLEGLPAQEWKTVTVARSGRYRRPRLHEDMIKLTDISSKFRQIAVKNIGRDEPTPLITNDVTTPGKNLFARYAER